MKFSDVFAFTAAVLVAAADKGPVAERATLDPKKRRKADRVVVSPDKKRPAKRARIAVSRVRRSSLRFCVPVPLAVVVSKFELGLCCWVSELGDIYY